MYYTVSTYPVTYANISQYMLFNALYNNISNCIRVKTWLIYEYLLKSLA